MSLRGRLWRPGSVQLRLAIFSTFWVGLTLLVVGVAAYGWLTNRALSTLDRSLRGQAASMLGGPVRPYPWRHLDRQSQHAYPASDGSPALVFIAYQMDYTVLFRSRQWPDGLDPRYFAPEFPPDWAVLAVKERPHRPPPDRPPREERLRMESGVLAKILTPRREETVTSAGAQWRFATFADERDVLVIGRRFDSLDLNPEIIRNWYAAAVPPSLLLTFLVTLLITSRALKPLNALTQSVETITARGLNQRIDAASEDREFTRLISVFNGMLERLHASFNRTRQFSAFAAHELKTPLAILRSEIEAELRAEEAGSPRQQFLAQLLSDVSRLKTGTEKLLLLFRADAGSMDLTCTEFDLAELLSKLAEDAEILAPALRIEADLTESAPIVADRTLLTHAIQNLVTNAIQHNRGGADGFVRIELKTTENQVEIGIGNSAAPIPPETGEQIFTMFQSASSRPEMSLSRSGLGLALAREIARAHGGDLRLAESTHQRTRFVLTIPRSPCPKATN